MRAAAIHQATAKDQAWAEASGRCFFAWRMAAACEAALREVHQALKGQHDPERAQALQKVSSLLNREMRRWVRQGEALDEIVDHLSHQS